MGKGKKAKIGRHKKTHGIHAMKVVRASELRKVRKWLIGKSKEQPISKIMKMDSNFDCDVPTMQESNFLFDVSNDGSLKKESNESFEERVRGVFVVYTKDEKWYANQLAKAEKWKPRINVGGNDGKVKVVFWKSELADVHQFSNGTSGIKKADRVRNEIRQLMSNMCSIFVKRYEDKVDCFNVDECIGYLKTHMTWTYFKSYSTRHTKLPGVGKRSKCKNSIRAVYQSLLREVIELAIDMKYAHINSWEMWRKMVLEPRIRDENCPRRSKRLQLK